MTTLQQQPNVTSLEEEKRTQRAFRLILVIGLIITLASSLVFIRILSEGFGPDLLDPGAGIIAGILCLVAAALAKRHHLTAAVCLIVIALFGADLFLIYRLTEVGLPLTIIFTIILILIASQILPPKQVSYGIVIIFAIGAIIMLLDLFWPLERGNINRVDLQIIYVAALIIIGISFVVALRQFSGF